ALSSAKAVAKDIVAAVNAHYGDTVAAEADLSYYKTASKNFEDSYWEANKRAEAAEKRAEQAEIDRSELLKYYERYQEAAKRAEAAEARVRELEKTHAPDRSEEHTSELQSRENLVCRLLLEKKK